MEAVNQHFIAKHSAPIIAGGMHTNGLVMTSTAKNEVSSVTNRAITLIPCPVCNWELPNEESLRKHLEEGVVPPPQLVYLCDLCQKSCRGERGLKQHLNFCRGKYICTGVVGDS